VRKALDTMRHQVRQKRGGGHVLGESALLVSQGGEGEGLAEVLGREPTPEDVARFADDYRSMLAKLDDPSLRSIAQRRLEGQTTQQIAAANKVSTKTIERKLQLIRAIWNQENSQ
jgi:DNA-directed RNA polymerase specialized sigma24 family protein